MNSNLQNVFLDFLNRDSREIYGLYANCTPDHHVRLVVEALNVAALLCKDNCLAPPGFLAECAVARRALGMRSSYLSERLILLPMRENSLEEFFEKKREEYSPFQDRYSGLFGKRPPKILRDAFQSIVRRNTEIGNTLVKDWKAGLDTDPVWRRLSQGCDTRDLAIIRTIPDQLREEGLAVTWTAIESRIVDLLAVDPTRFRIAVQYHYFRLYVNEFGLTVVTNLPFAKDSFGIERADFCYDYELLKSFADALGLWQALAAMSAPSILRLRQRAAFFAFRNNLHAIGLEMGSLYNARYAFAIASQMLERTEFPAFATRLRIAAITSPDRGIELNDDEISGVAMLLDVGSQHAITALREIVETLKEEEHHAMTPLSVPKKSGLFHIAIFVALREERTVLVRRWSLQNPAGSDFWTGNLGRCRITLFSPNEMGRVAAALATEEVIRLANPDLIIVSGIAAGIPEEKVELGDVLIPRAVIDLASRKMRDIDKKLENDFRPREFVTDRRLIQFVDSGEFRLIDWQVEVVKNDWPDHRRPALRYANVASLDDVVASDSWRRKLHASWTKLEGIEMEAGGVCKAAERANVKVSVVRGVSDLADPVKSDTQWRKLAILSAASLIEKFAASTIAKR